MGHGADATPAGGDMDVIVKRIIDQRRNADGTWTLLAEAEIGGTVIEQCRITLPPDQPGRMPASGSRPGLKAPTARDHSARNELPTTRAQDSTGR